VIYSASSTGEASSQFHHGLQGTAGARFKLHIDDTVINATIQDTGNSRRPVPVFIDVIEIEEPGKHAFSIKPVDDGNWNGFFFQGVEMRLIE
jgi:hypothetical protein